MIPPPCLSALLSDRLKGQRHQRGDLTILNGKGSAILKGDGETGSVKSCACHSRFLSFRLGQFPFDVFILPKATGFVKGQFQRIFLLIGFRASFPVADSFIRKPPILRTSIHRTFGILALQIADIPTCSQSKLSLPRSKLVLYMERYLLERL